MALRVPSPYEFKKALMWPRKLYMRHKENFEPGFIRSAMELHYYRPAFYRWCGAVANNPDLLHEANIDETSVVVDAGAYIGEWARDISERYNATIHAFEPDPRNFRQLEELSRTRPGINAYEFGLGEKTERVRMTLEYLGSSMFPGAGDRGDTPSAEVEIRDIAEIWKTLGLGRVDFMKINIEGAEFPLLERMMETDLLKSVDCFLIQFHEWHPGAYRRRRKIRKALSRSHELAWDHHFVWEKWTRK